MINIVLIRKYKLGLFKQLHEARTDVLGSWLFIDRYYTEYNLNLKIIIITHLVQVQMAGSYQYYFSFFSRKQFYVNLNTTRLNQRRVAQQNLINDVQQQTIIINNYEKYIQCFPNCQKNQFSKFPLIYSSKMIQYQEQYKAFSLDSKHLFWLRHKICQIFNINKSTSFQAFIKEFINSSIRKKEAFRELTQKVSCLDRCMGIWRDIYSMKYDDADKVLNKINSEIISETQATVFKHMVQRLKHYYQDELKLNKLIESNDLKNKSFLDQPNQSSAIIDELNGRIQVLKKEKSVLLLSQLEFEKVKLQNSQLQETIKSLNEHIGKLNHQIDQYQINYQSKQSINELNNTHQNEIRIKQAEIEFLNSRISKFEAEQHKFAHIYAEKEKQIKEIQKQVDILRDKQFSRSFFEITPSPPAETIENKKQINYQDCPKCAQLIKNYQLKSEQFLKIKQLQEKDIDSLRLALQDVFKELNRSEKQTQSEKYKYEQLKKDKQREIENIKELHRDQINVLETKHKVEVQSLKSKINLNQDESESNSLLHQAEQRYMELAQRFSKKEKDYQTINKVQMNDLREKSVLREKIKQEQLLNAQLKQKLNNLQIQLEKKDKSIKTMTKLIKQKEQSIESIMKTSVMFTKPFQ